MWAGSVEPNSLPGIAYNAGSEPIAPRVCEEPENVAGELAERQARDVTR